MIGRDAPRWLRPGLEYVPPFMADSRKAPPSGARLRRAAVIVFLLTVVLFVLWRWRVQVGVTDENRETPNVTWTSGGDVRPQRTDDASPAPLAPPTRRTGATLDAAVRADADPPSASSSNDAELDAGGTVRDERTEATRWLEENARQAKEHVERFCEESERLRESGLGDGSKPGDPPPTRDAWAFMAVRVDWEGGRAPPGLLHLSEPLRQRLRGYGAAWPLKIVPSDYAGLDFGWMSALHAFDHWNVLRDLPSQNPNEVGFHDAPIPNFFELQNWAKLRLARALEVGDFAAASADLRQLAKLLRTTGLVIGDMVAFKLLDLEREAHAVAVAQGRAVAGWTPYATDDLQRYRRLARSAPWFLYPGVPEDVMARALACNAVSACSPIYEGVGSHTAMAHLSDVNTTAAMARLAGRAGCDDALLGWLKRTPQLNARQIIDAYGPSESLERLLTGERSQTP